MNERDHFLVAYFLIVAPFALGMILIILGGVSDDNTTLAEQLDKLNGACDELFKAIKLEVIVALCRAKSWLSW